MIVISDLSQSYVQEVAAVEMSTVVGGFGSSYTKKIAVVDVTQLNLVTYKSENDSKVIIIQSDPVRVVPGGG